MMTSAPNRIAIVTGGSRGLGRNTVVNLAKRGVHAILTYNSSPGEAETVVAATEEAGTKAIALELDTGDVSSFDAFVTQVREALSTLGEERIDIWSTTPACRTTPRSRN